MLDAEPSSTPYEQSKSAMNRRFCYNPQLYLCSLSPGLIATDMGDREKGEGAAMLDYTAEKRMGTPEELGFAIAMAADERNGYLAGVDILVDGGSVNGKNA